MGTPGHIYMRAGLAMHWAPRKGNPMIWSFFKIKVNPGVKQRVMRNGQWDGKPWRMTYTLGIQKGWQVVLEERGINTHKMSADRMRETLGSLADFLHEKSSVERFLHEEKRHIIHIITMVSC